MAISDKEQGVEKAFFVFEINDLGLFWVRDSLVDLVAERFWLGFFRVDTKCMYVRVLNFTMYVKQLYHFQLLQMKLLEFLWLQYILVCSRSLR